MAKICLCLTGKTIQRNLEILNKYRKFTDVAELRADYLEPDERFSLRKFPELAGIPVILTVRREIDGGQYKGGEGARIVLLSKGLAFADVNRRKNFAYVDLEEDLNVPGLEEAARTFGTRIIRSYHNCQGMEENLPERLRSLRHVGDEIVKVAVMPQSFHDVLRVYQAAQETIGFDKILLCMGHFGVNTRILAEHLGSYLSYTAVQNEPDMPSAAPGQLDPKELAELYRFREITYKTRLFGILGYPLRVTSSPIFFNRVFGEENIDAVYIPFPSDSLESFLELAELLHLEGVSVTVPYKQAVMEHLEAQSDEVKHVGACNTLVHSPRGWMGYNTDARGFSDSLMEFIKKKTLKGKRLTIIGAGGAARAVAAEIYRLKGSALILNRTSLRARELAAPYKFAWGGTDTRGIEQMNQFQDIIIQTTSVGMEPDIEEDPLEEYIFSGKEAVMDLIYKPEQTRFLQRAVKAGCTVINGYDMLLRQARYQYNLYMGKEFPSQLLSRIQL